MYKGGIQALELLNADKKTIDTLKKNLKEEESFGDWLERNNPKIAKRLMTKQVDQSKKRGKKNKRQEKEEVILGSRRSLSLEKLYLYEPIWIGPVNYGEKDEFTFKVHDGTVFSKDAKISIKIEKNEKLSRDQVQQNDKQPNRERPSQSPSDEKKSIDDKSNKNDTPPSDSNDQSSSPTQDAEQQKSDVKEEQKQSSDSDKSTSDAETANGDHSQPT